MERCTTTSAAANCAGRYTDFVPTGCCGESSYTARRAYADPYADYRRANAAERVNYQRTATSPQAACECDLSAAELLPVTMGYVPVQEWCNTYDTQTALCRGTLFPELFKPFVGSRGGCYDR
ncbi:MAG: spore coat associated protein CotJA [Oscillospiraceae bacterium]|nr:spore coat associated protein CotJA [Oscillospiraceae bacterium]